MKKTLSTKAFTLIELLIVIAIIAILAVTVIIAINPGEQLAKARDATRERHVKAVESAIYTYHIDNLEFPSDLANSLGSEICNTNIIPSNECGDLIDLSPLVEEGYLPQIPINPTTEKNTSSTGYNIATIEDKVAVWPTESETRQIGTRVALSFDGKNDNYVSTPNIEIPEAYSISQLVKGNINNQIEENIYGFGWNGKIALRHSFGGNNPLTGILIRNKADDNYYSIQNYNNHLDDERHHLIATVDRNKNPVEVKVYLDGELEVYGTVIDHFQDIQMMTIGTWSTGYGHFTGVVNDVRIYERILALNEIRSLHNGQNITDGLVGHWPLSEGQGCTAYDHSGNDNHGTLEPDCPEGGPEWVIGR